MQLLRGVPGIQFDLFFHFHFLFAKDGGTKVQQYPALVVLSSAENGRAAGGREEAETLPVLNTFAEEKKEGEGGGGGGGGRRRRDPSLGWIGFQSACLAQLAHKLLDADRLMLCA